MRSVTRCIRFTPEELATLTAAAEKADRTFTDFVRRVAIRAAKLILEQEVKHEAP